MSARENKEMSNDKMLIVSKENIFSKIAKFIKGIFLKKNKIETNNNGFDVKKEEEKQKEKFLNNLQESTNAEKTVERVMKDTSVVYNMSIQELKNLNNAIKIRQDILNQRVVELKKQISSYM